MTVANVHKVLTESQCTRAAECLLSAARSVAEQEQGKTFWTLWTRLTNLPRSCFTFTKWTMCYCIATGPDTCTCMLILRGSPFTDIP